MATYLVTLPTGKQGRATISALLQAGAKVNAVVRDPTKDTARELESQGVVLFKGGNDDFDVFRAAAQGCKGVFLNVLHWPEISDPSKQAQGILKACIDAGVKHVVLSTVGWAGDRAKWDVPLNTKSFLAEYYKHEHQLEEVVRTAKIPSYTILRPFWFHANYLPPSVHAYYPNLLSKSEIVHSFAPGTRFPHIHVDDIGRFAAAALQEPARFHKHEIELASENLTINEVAATLEKALGRKVVLKQQKPDEVDFDQPVVAWEMWANSADLTVDVKALKQYGVPFTTLEDHLTSQKELLVSAIKQ